MPVATTFQLGQTTCLQTSSSHSSDENLSMVTIRIQFHSNCWNMWNHPAVRNNMFHSQCVGGTPDSSPVLSERSLYLPVSCKSRHCCGRMQSGWEEAYDISIVASFALPALFFLSEMLISRSHGSWRLVLPFDNTPQHQPLCPHFPRAILWLCFGNWC